MAVEIATHDSPAWGSRADFLIFADLAPAGMPGRFEQLWARRLGDQSFEVCCIPYFTYGLALGDTVRTQPVGGKNHVVAEVRARSGRRVLRLWLKNARAGARERVLQYLGAYSPLHEWSSDSMLALDVAPPGPDAALSALLTAMPGLGIDTEWGE